MEPTRNGRFAAIKKWILKLVERSHDPFWLLDMFLILAGARFTPRNRYQRIGWILYRILACPQPPIALLCFVSSVVFEESSATIVRNFAVFASFILSLVKQRLLSQKFGGILTIRGLLEASDFCSGNSDLDESVRKRFKRTSRTIIITITSIIAVQQIVCWIPSEPRDMIFKIPPWIALRWGEKVSSVIKDWYIFVSFICWISKMYGCTVTTAVLMMGFEAEQAILAHSFGKIEDSLQDLRQNYWDCELTRKQYWERLKTLVRVSFDQQQLLLRYLKELQSLVEDLFLLIFYASLVLFGMDLYIILYDQSIFMFVTAAGFVLLCSLEVYSLCYLVDSLKDVFEPIAGHLHNLCARLPYSEDHHKDYLGMRNTLQIIAMCSRNAVSFGCAGVAEISVKVFAEMLNNCYSVYTFLREMI